MKKIYKILGFCVLCLIVLTIKSNAATATLVVDKTDIKVGDTVKATVTYTAAAWDLKVSADDKLSTSNTTQYADSSESADNVTKSFTVSYTAKESGTVSIKLSGNVTDESATSSTSVNDTKTIKISEKDATSTQSTTTQQQTPVTKSNNANLKTLGVTPKEYDFTGFQKDKTEYTLPNPIPSSVDKLNVLYKTEDSNAKAVVTGNTNLKVGSDNKIVVKVTAEDGTTKEYTIKVTKLAEDEEKPGNVIEDETELFLTKLEVEGLELSPEFEQKTYSYNAVLNENKEEVKVTAIANNSKAKVTISGNTELKDGENTITIIVTLDGKVEQKVYQITLNKNLESESETEKETAEVTEVKGGMIGNVERYIVVGAGLIVFIILVILILIYLIRKETKKEKMKNKKAQEEIKLYNQDETENYRKTIEEINAQTQSIFNKDKEEQSVEYSDEDNLQEKIKRGKGKH